MPKNASLENKYLLSNIPDVPDASFSSYPRIAIYHCDLHRISTVRELSIVFQPQLTVYTHTFVWKISLITTYMYIIRNM